MHFRRSFSDYYDSIEFINKTENETITGNGNYYIHHAVFSFHYQNRAVFLDSDSKVLLDSCSFYKNSAKGRGGSFHIMKSDCILIHVCCSLSSSINLWGSAYHIYSALDSNIKSYAFECSVSQCSGFGAAYFHYQGDIQVSNMNTSYNKITSYAGYAIQDPTGTGTMNLTTTFNSFSSQSGGMYNSGDFHITKCNYIDNEYTGSESGIIISESNCIFSDCSFIRNKGNYIFDVKPNFDHCSFINNSNIRVARDYAVKIDSGEPLNTFLSHFSTYYCPGSFNFNDENDNINVDHIHKNSYEEEIGDNINIKYLIQLDKYVSNTSLFEIVKLIS